MSDENDTNIPQFTRDGQEERPTEPGNESGQTDELAELESEWTEGPPDVEGEEESAIGDFVESLRSTEPHKPLSEIESPWDPENGGIPRIYRGIQKFSGIEGTEAWMDITIGMLEWMQSMDTGGNSSSNESDEDMPIEEVTVE